VLKPGDEAPDVPLGNDRLHRMLEEREVVLFFFPKAFTPGCTREACGFRDDYAALRKAGMEVIGVSGDPQETQDRFAQSLGLSFPLVGDPEGKIRDAYEVKWPVIGLARRTTYVIGRDRRIKLAFRSELDALAHVAGAREYAAKPKPGRPGPE